MKYKQAMEVCDNPDCNVSYPSDKDEPAYGFHFTKGFFVYNAGGGPIPATYACSEKCIIPALKEMMRRSV